MRIRTGLLLGALLLWAFALGPALAVEDVNVLARKLKDRDKYVRKDAVKDLAKHKSLEANRLIVGAFADAESIVRDWAYEKLKEVKDPASLAYLRDEAILGPEGIRIAVLDVLGERGEKEAVPSLLKVLSKYPDAPSRAATARALGWIGDAAAYAALEERATKERDPLVLIDVHEAMARIDRKRGVPVLLAALDHKDWRVQAGAFAALRLFGLEAAFDAALARLDHKAWPVQSHAIEILGASQRKEAIEALIPRLDKEEGRIRHEIYQALVNLTGQEDLDDTTETWSFWWGMNRASFDPKTVKERRKGKGQKTGVVYHGLPVSSNRLVFILDHSATMEEPVGGDGENKDMKKVDLARIELQRVITLLEASCRFNVVAYGRLGGDTVVSTWKPRLEQATRRARATAVDWADRFTEGKGWTPVYDAIARAMDDPEADTCYLLSDGEPSTGEYKFTSRILRKFGEWNRWRRMQVFAIRIGGFSGDGAEKRERTAREFLTELAGSTGGEFVSR